MQQDSLSQEPLELLGQTILPGQSTTVNFNIANLYTATKVEVPVIVERSKEPGPTVLITAGIHGDEVNGVEVVRQIIARGINKPKRGTIICIPILNVFGFLTMNRYFPDGKDLNRVFPGSKNGSLASRFAYQFVNEILPYVDLCLDFHAGGADRFNAPQIRIEEGHEKLLELAKVFNAPFTLFSKNLKKTYRTMCSKMQIDMLLFEGGKSKNSNKDVAREGVEGTIRVLKHLNMLIENIEASEPKDATVMIHKSAWLRAKYSGLLHLKVPYGAYIEKGAFIATITDPYGTFRYKVKAPNSGYVINTNESPMVYQGDAIFHITQE